MSDAELSSWHALVTHVSQTFHYDLFGDEAIRFLFPFGASKLEVFIKHAPRPGKQPWIVIGVRLAHDAGMDLSTLAESREPVGSLCMIGTHLCLTHSLPLHGLRRGHVEATLAALGAATARYREKLSKRTADNNALAYLYE